MARDKAVEFYIQPTTKVCKTPNSIMKLIIIYLKKKETKKG